MRQLIKHVRKVPKHHFHKLKNSHFFFKFKYPKLAVLALSILLAYAAFTNPYTADNLLTIHNLGYLGVFGIGILFSFGFTSPFAVGFLLTIQPDNLFLAAIIGGLGALTADMLIFRVIKISFMDEFNKLKKEKPLQLLTHGIKNRLGAKLSNYLLFLLAGIIIASPLPDEIGITMLAGLTAIRPGPLAILSFCFNTVGIFIILLIGA